MPYRRRYYYSSRRGIPFFSLFSLVPLVLLAGVFFWLWRGSQFGRFDRFNLVLASSPVTLVSLDSRQGTATMVKFPDDLYVSQVVPNYGSYRIAAVYRVGELDHRGGQVLSWTVSDLLGVPVDGFLVAQESTDIRKLFFNPATYWRSQTSLNLFDLIRFGWAWVGVRSDKIKLVDISTLATPLLLADGSTAHGVDKEQLDSSLSGSFVERTIRDEGLRLEVLNGTAAPGLGTRAARVLNNVGATVINVGSDAPQQASCLVRAQKTEMRRRTVLRAAEIYNCRVTEQNGDNRADVSVILGQDFAQKFLK